MACLWILANLSLMIKLVNSFFFNSQLFEFTCDSVTLCWTRPEPNWRSVCSSVCCCSWGLSTRPSVLMGLWVHSVSIPHHLCQIFPWVSRQTLTSRWVNTHTRTHTHTSTCKGRVQVEVHVVFLMKYLHHWCWVFICFIWTEKYSDVMMFLEIICSRRFKPRRQTC